MILLGIIVSIILLVLQLASVIAFPWWIILMPIFIAVGINVLIGIVAGVLALIIFKKIK